jgi:hypothetical protein
MAAAAAPNYAPDPVQDFGNVSTINPAQSAGAQGTATNAGYAPQVQALNAQGSYIDPNTAYAQEQTMYNQQAAALAPQFQQQQSQLADANAARGITNSGAGGQLQANLYGQQAGVLSGADAQFTSQGAGFNQQDLLANQQTGNQFALANQNAGMQAQTTNSELAQGVNLQNSQLDTGTSNSNAQLAQQNNQFNATNQNNALNYNADVNNQALLDNWQATNQYNQNLENQEYGLANEGYQTYLNSLNPSTTAEQGYNNAAGYANNAYTGAFESANQAQGAALGAAGSLAGSMFGVPTGVGGGGGYSGPGDTGSYGGWGGDDGTGLSGGG